MRRYCGFLTILCLCSFSEAFISNRKDAANKNNQVRGGFAKTRKGRFSPRMAISSSQLPRKAKGTHRHGLSRSHQRTRVRYANDGEHVLALPPRRTSPGGLLFPPYMEESRLRRVVRKQQPPLIKPLDLAVFCTYLCSSLVMNLPIVLLPMAAAEHATGKAVSSLVVSITSIAIMGGGLGKVINGFVCQEFGGKNSSALYLVGGAVCSLLFSMASVPTLGYAYAGIEFCASMQWTALSVVFAQHYEGDSASFATGITCLSLASTSGQLLAKFLGMTLLSYFNWRTVAQLGALVALVGSGIVHTFVSELPVSFTGKAISSFSRKPFEWKRLVSSIQDSAGSVLSNPLFWAIGYTHAMSMVARSSDRILGEFFLHATDLPRFICGGLTLSVTVGLVHGLVSGRAFHNLKNASSQKSFVARRYIGAVLSALALAVVAHPSISSLVHSKVVMAGILTSISAIMTSCMAFQFFQIPSMVAQTFGDKKAVCISWIDATAFFINAPVWACVGRLVETRGWSAAFIMIAALFGLGGMAMMRAVSPVLEKQGQGY